MKEKVKMILASKGYSAAALVNVFNCTPQSASTKVFRGIKTINDLILICDFCNAQVSITLENGTVIKLHESDIEQGS